MTAICPCAHCGVEIPVEAETCPECPEPGRDPGQAVTKCPECGGLGYALSAWRADSSTPATRPRWIESAAACPYCHGTGETEPQSIQLRLAAGGWFRDRQGRRVLHEGPHGMEAP